MAKRLFIKYGSLRQDTHDAVTVPYDPATFNFGYELEIHDRDYPSAATQISEISSDGAVISQKGSSDMNKVIVPTILSFTMFINSAAEQSFLEDLISGDEERFYVKLYHRQQLIFTGYILIEQVSQDINGSYRALNITATDGLTRLKEINYPIESPAVEASQRFGVTNDTSIVQYIDITANYNKDGVATTKDLTLQVYPSGNFQEIYTLIVDIGVIDSLTFDTIVPPSTVTINTIGSPIYNTILSETTRIGYPTFMETIVRCFEESNVSTLYSSTYPLFNVYTNWEESEMDFTNTDRPGLLDQMACQSNLFLNISQENEEEVSITSSSNSFNCYKVLETILSILHCKMFYENGRYYIRHAWGSEATNGDMNYKSYQPDGTYISAAITEKSEQLGYEGTDVIRLISPSSTKYLAPYKYCEIELTAQTNNIGLSSDIIIAPDYDWRKFNTFLEGERIRLSIDFYHSITNTDGDLQLYVNGFWEFNYQVKVGNYYLSMDLGDTIATWSTDSTKVVKYRPYTTSSNIEDYIESTKSFYCDPLLEDGDFELRLVLVQFNYDNNNIYYRRAEDSSLPDINTSFIVAEHSLQVKLVTQNEDHNGKFTYRSSAVIGNTRVKNIKTILGELDQVVDNISQIYTWNETLDKMIPNEDDTHIRDWGGGISLMRKLLNSYYSTHSNSKEIIVGSVDDTVNRLSYDTVLEWYGKDYMPISLERITGKDRYKGQWIEVGKTVVDNSDDNVDIFYIPTRNGFLGSGLLGGISDEMFQNSSEQNGNAMIGNLLFSRTYYITDQNYAQILLYTIPEDLSIYKRRSIDDSFILYVNGVRWIYEIEEADVTKAGQFWLEEDTLNWKFFRPITGSVRLEVWDRLIVELDATI